MKVRAYMRVSKNGYKVKVDASTKMNVDPLFKISSYQQKEFLPTVGFAVDFDIPDELFSKASVVIAEVNVGLKGAKILTALPVPEKVSKSSK